MKIAKTTLKNKKIIKESKTTYKIPVGRDVEFKDEPRYYKKILEQEKRSLFFK